MRKNETYLSLETPTYDLACVAALRGRESLHETPYFAVLTRSFSQRTRNLIGSK
jgi:hypothetical protein